MAASIGISGMASLTPEERTKAMTDAHNRQRAHAQGWPDSIEKWWDTTGLTHKAATWEWTKRMEKSKRRS
jgi:hypothetical protein